MSQWGLLSWEPDLDIRGKTNLGVKVSVLGRTSILFHKARVTMMIWKQRAKLVMATARWVLKHPVYGIVILRLGIYTNRPNVSKLCSFISSMDSPVLISVIQENKLLASVLCFQKICLLSTNDFFFLTITCRPSMSSSLFFCFIFIFTKLYTHGPLWGKLFFVHLHSYTWRTIFRIHIRTLFLYVTQSIHKSYPCSKIFRFSQHTPVVHTKVSLYTLVAHTHKNFFSHIVYTHKILLYTFSFYIYINKNLFLFLYIRNHLFTTLLSFYPDFGSFFWFWTTFLKWKILRDFGLQQTLLTTTK